MARPTWTAPKDLPNVPGVCDMKHGARLILVLALVGVAAFSSVPASASASHIDLTTTTPTATQAQSILTCQGCFLPYPGVQCGPDMHVAVGTVSTGPGYIFYEALVWEGTFWTYVTGTYGAGGSHTTVIASRIMNSYLVAPENGATIQWHASYCSS